jgi:hypothetical protein
MLSCRTGGGLGTGCFGRRIGRGEISSGTTVAALLYAMTTLRLKG